MFKELNTMELFFNEPSREFGVREAAKLLDVAPATASKDLAELAEKGFLKVREDRRTILYSANVDSENYRDLKVFHTVKMLKDKGLVQSLSKFYPNSSIVLFGSAANGTDKEISGIDLIILSEKTDVFPDKESFEKIFGRKITLIVAKNLTDITNKQVVQSAVNGRILQGEISL